ncbi:MAG: NGG1p interacting factor NIF3 [Patescibacteria group bacterium]|nr:NGG1p interacting factor NIF3 [Patescibacteria group bacterium]MDD5121412.1 NGG1p interacting factor NIF3 [Patescibacteria group bacterium]MDD5221862.1 NGG1p interacting factor NIF3 [Patescibacteria group bacterium]MDD5395669.1 NGG1p interacting factor NIF3 [Patescibacteria group bacterium]
MNAQQIYQLAIKLGTEADLRGKATVSKMLTHLKKKYEELSKDQKEEFDKERLINPFSDTRVLVDDKKQIKKILTGVDIGVGELLLADKLGGVDLVLAHHPEGIGLAGLDDVMHLQADVLSMYGVPINIAENLVKIRIDEVSRKLSPANHNEVVDAAKLLKMNLMCVHTPADNFVASFLDKMIKKEKPEYVEDLLKLLKSIPEYKEAIKLNAGPRLFSGRPENHCGKIALTELTGGTEGSPLIFEKLAQVGIGTVVAMHMSEEHRKEAEKAHINVVVAGHMASDSLGMNLFLDELAKQGIKIISCSGLIRVERFKKAKK